MNKNKFNFYQSPKKNNKYLWSTAAVFVLAALVLSQFITIFSFSETSSAQGLNPRFNMFTPYSHTQTEGRDYYLLDVKNDTKGTNWGDYFSATPGDILTFSVYYHNGVLNTIARNTTLRVSLPQGSNSYFQSVSAYLWADNADNATASNPMSQTLSVNTSSQGNLDFIEGSAKWYPNQTDWRSDAPASLPNGQSGDGLISSGLRLGDIAGCWEYSGYVNFQVRVVAQAPAPILNLSISKTVKNISDGQGSYAESTNAKSGDQVSFQIQVQNTGNGTLNNLYVRDSLPSSLSSISGSATLNGNNLSDSLISGGVNIGTLGVGSSATISFRATVNGSTISQTLTNTAYARADQVSERSDTVWVYVSQPPAPILNLSISKTVKNISDGQGSYAESTNAKSGDQVSFQIQVQNTGNGTLNNLYVRDSLPSSLSSISGSATLNGNNLSDSLISGGVNIGTLGVGSSATISFRATVNGSTISQTLTNTAYARADQVSERSDTAWVYVSQPPAPTLNLSISKTVKNISDGQGSYAESTNAKSGDQVSFQIQVQNTGNGTLNNLYVRDSLPSSLSYISGSATLNGNNLSDSLISGGVNIGTLGVGSSATISFRATVNGSTISQTLTNTAYARADQVSERSDTAWVYVAQEIAREINLTKSVKNLTDGQTSFVSSTNAHPGDRLIYSIQVSSPSSSQQINNVRVWDNLPSGISYVSGTTRIDGSYASDSLFSGGLNLGSFSGSQSRNITFEATVNAGTYYNQTLTNTAYASADNVAQRSAYAQVIISSVPLPPPPAPIIIAPTGFVKKVANITSPNGTDTDNQARIGEILQYTLSYTNTTGAALYNVEFNDVLPPYAAFQSVTLGGGNYDSSKNWVVWGLGTIAPGASIVVSYQVKVADGPTAGTVIINSALMRSSAFGDLISNEVRTTVLVPPVVTPVKAVTGSNSLRDSLIYSGLISLMFVFAVYFVLRHSDSLRLLKLKWKIFRIKAKGSV